MFEKTDYSIALRVRAVTLLHPSIFDRNNKHKPENNEFSSDW